MSLEPEVVSTIWEFCEIPQLYIWSSLTKQYRKIYRSTPVSFFLQKAKSPEEALQIFINYYAYLPKQGSQKWKEIKQGKLDMTSESEADEIITTVGGSEIGTLMGLNTYDRKGSALFASKLGLNEFRGNASTRWGNLFEEVAAQLMERWFHTETFETGSLPGMRNSRQQVMQTYSPDRIGVIFKKKLIEVMRGRKFVGKKEFQQFCKEAADELTVLFEFKCPTSRIPTDEIPANYRMQPQLGMATIPITDLSIFVDAAIRKCSVEDFGWNNDYDTIYHAEDKLVVPDQPIVCGFIGIYHYDESTPHEVESPVKSTLRLTELQLADLARDMHWMMIDEMSTPGSDFAEVPLNISGLVPLISLCDKLMTPLYGLREELQNYEVTSQDEAEICRLALQNIFPMNPTEQHVVQTIIPAALKLNYRLRSEHASLDDIEYGMDFGNASEGNFDAMLKTVVDDRFKVPGLRAYYPEGFYMAEPTECDMAWRRPGDYVDMTLEEPERAQQWLCRETKKFVQECHKQGWKPIGIIPWKLFQIAMIPALKEPGFLDRVRSHVEEFTNRVHALKQQARKLPEAERKKFLQAEYDKVFPPSSRTLKNRENREKRAVVKAEVQPAEEPVVATAPAGGFNTVWDDVDA